MKNMEKLSITLVLPLFFSVSLCVLCALVVIICLQIKQKALLYGRSLCSFIKEAQCFSVLIRKMYSKQFTDCIIIFRYLPCVIFNISDGKPGRIFQQIPK